MSTENVELARRIHGAWNDRDLETMRALADPEVEYVNSPTAVEPGTIRAEVLAFGPDEVPEALQAAGLSQ